MSTDLSSPQVRAQLAKMLNSDVAATSVRDFEEGPRTHLGASIMGEACKRKPWGVFRHLRHEKHSGRMHRLFKRGHREEPHFIERLRAVGFEIFEHDPATGKQFRWRSRPLRRFGRWHGIRPASLRDRHPRRC
jgi:hypothetical protein